MQFNDIAKAFGMTSRQFCEQIGYQRQTLYVSVKYSAKAREAVRSLHDLNSLMQQMDIDKANLNFERRKQAIHEFENRLKECGADGREQSKR